MKTKVTIPKGEGKEGTTEVTIPEAGRKLVDGKASRAAGERVGVGEMVPARQNDFITEVRALNRQWWEAVNRLKSLQREYNALDYGNTLADGSGANAGVTKLMVGAVLFDTTNAFEAVLNAGHATNMSKLL